LEPAMDGLVVGIAVRQEMPLGAGIQNPEHASKTARVGSGLRPGRLSGMCSSGKCSRICSHCSSRRRCMTGLIEREIRAVNYFEIGSSLLDTSFASGVPRSGSTNRTRTRLCVNLVHDRGWTDRRFPH
jgi:hypothetical protein